MSAYEFVLWREYLSYGTFFERLFDKHLSRLTALLANVYRDRSKRSFPYRLDEFYLLAQKRSSSPSPERLLQKLIFINRMMGGTFIDKRKQADGGQAGDS